MAQTVYRYDFGPTIELEEVEATLVLAIVATEALHGETAAQLAIGHFLDAKQRACVIDAGSQVGSDFNLIFHGFIRREFGPGAFSTRRMTTADSISAVAA